MARGKNHHLILRGGTWHFTAMINGRRVQQSLYTVSLTEARKKRDEYMDEIRLYGVFRKGKSSADSEVLFGEVAQLWAKITSTRVKSSTMEDYRSAMNFYILQRFGNTPIKDMTYMQIEEFASELDCSAKRINNILVPLRGVFKMALKGGLIDKNIMTMIENRRTERAEVKALSMEEVNRFLEVVSPHYQPFFSVAFFTGMRGGEMSALKWENVDFDNRLIHVVETRVYGVEGRPKTRGSHRTITMLPMTYRALKDQATRTRLRSPYVFLNQEAKPVDVETLRKTVWIPGLKKAKIPYLPMKQTRHTFATLMISAGENLGWVQRMMGHSSLKMITESYFSFIPNHTHSDGSRFVSEYEKKLPDLHQSNTRQPSDSSTTCN